MKNLIVYQEGDDLLTKLEDIPVWSYNDNEVLIKVVAAGSNPKDWKHPRLFNIAVNQGDDVAGIVEAVGSRVKHLHKGDRVAGFHVMDTATGGAYAEYAVCPGNTVFHIPDSMTFEEAATLPLAAYTAAVGLFRVLDVPFPTQRSDDAAAETAKVPLVVNAASGAVGAFAVQLAKLNPRISPIVGIAGASIDHAKSIGCDAVVSYRSNDVAGDLLKALGGKKVARVFDAFNTVDSVKYLLAVLEPKIGRYVSTSGDETFGEQQRLLEESGVYWERVWVGSVHEDKLAGSQLFGSVVSRIFEQMLEDGLLKPQPYTIVSGGLNGVRDALIQLKTRKGGNTKFVTRIADN